MVVMCCMFVGTHFAQSLLVFGRNLKRVLAKRRQIQVRRRVDDEYMASWFQYAAGDQKGAQEMVRVLSRSATAKT